MYVDGFIIPVKTARKADYEEVARAAALVFKDHGALRVVETWAEDAPMGAFTSFPRSVQLEADETAVFAWIEYPDRAARDACNSKVFEDPRMDALTLDGVIDGKRMIFGGFDVLVDT